MTATATRRTFSTYAANIHAVGGQTQAEATATISDARLRRASSGFLNSILRTLLKEASYCTTDEQYGPVRAQVDRVLAVLNSRPI